MAGREGVELTDDGAYTILQECRGDLRKAYNTLQAAASFRGEVDEGVIYKVVGRVRPEEVRDMLKLAFGGDFAGARDHLRKTLVEYGVSATDIIKQVHSEIFRFNLPERWKALLADTVGEIDFRISQGGNKEVQFSALLAKFVLAGEEMRRG